MLQPPHFGKERVAQDADVRLGQSGGGEDVDHLAGRRDGLAHELADGGVDLLGRLPVGAALLVQRGLQGLEKGSVVADRRRFIAGGAEGERAGKFRHHLHPTLLAVRKFQEVLLPSWNERETFRRFASHPVVPIKPVHQAADDAVFLQHHRDSLRGIESRVALIATFGVSDLRLFQLIRQPEIIHH